MSLSDPKGGLGYAFGEKLPSAHINTVFAQQPRALDATNGGSYTLGTALTWTINSLLTIAGTADIDFTGTGDLDIDKLAQLYNAEFDGQAVVNAGVNFEWTGTTNLPKIGSRAYSIAQPLIAIPTGNLWTTTPPKWQYYETSGEWSQADADNVAGYLIAFPLTRLPNQSTLDKVAVLINGAGVGGGSHGALPANLPQATLYQRSPGSGVTTLGATVTDTPGTFGNYDTEHVLGTTYPASWTWTGLAEPINFNTQYWIVVKGEYGANHADNALSVVHIECEFTCTEIAPG